MSYNVTSSEYLEGQLQIQAGTARRLIEELEGELAECDPISDLPLDGKPENEWLTIERFWWYGVWSGRGLDALKTILRHTRGAADIMLTWEGGDSHQALRVVDGELHDVHLEFVVVPVGESAPSTLPPSRLELLMDEDGE